MERSRTPCSPLRRALSTVMLATGSGLLVVGLVVRIGFDRAIALAKAWDLPAETAPGQRAPR